MDFERKQLLKKLSATLRGEARIDAASDRGITSGSSKPKGPAPSRTIEVPVGCGTMRF